MQKLKIKNKKLKTMLNYFNKKTIIFGLLFLVFGFLTGCGERTETTRYYYSPGWTRDGKVILVGATESVRKDIIGSRLDSSYSEYVMTVYPSGTGESAALFSVDAPPYHMSCSPFSGVDYVAYMDELRNDLYRKIVVRNIAPGEHTGLEVAELIFSPRIKSFDWSSDGTQIVYCTTREVRVRDWNDFIGATDSRMTAEANLTFVSWKYGGQIAFVSSAEAGKVLSVINPNTMARTDLAVGDSVDLPQISPTNTNLVFGVADGSFVYVDLSNIAAGRQEVVDNFSGELPRISPDGSKVTYSKSGETSGVYVLDISDLNNPVETKIK